MCGEGGTEGFELGDRVFGLFDGGGDLGVLAVAIEVAVVPGLLEVDHGWCGVVFIRVLHRSIMPMRYFLPGLLGLQAFHCCGNIM